MTNILTDKIGSLEIITLDRPEVLNALNSEMVLALRQKLKEIGENPDIAAVFIKGSGDKAFCAGGDIKSARLGAMAVREGAHSLVKSLNSLSRNMHSIKSCIILKFRPFPLWTESLWVVALESPERAVTG